MDNLSILLPFRSDDGGPRKQVFQWLIKYYERNFPEAELCISGDDPTNLLFNKSKAINACARLATRDVFLIADADMWFEPAIIRDALQRIYDVSWIIPYSTIFHLSKEETNSLVNLNSPETQPNVTQPIKVVDAAGANFVGGLNMITREKFKNIGGFDERFIGYGGEDDAFAMLVNTMYGTFTRFPNPIYHLWHPPSGPLHNPNYNSNFQLYLRYAEANGDREEMMKIIKERWES